MRLPDAAIRAGAERARELPVLPIRDRPVFPGELCEIAVGRIASLEVVRTALDRDGLVLALAQRDPDVDEPRPADLYSIGCVVHIQQVEAGDGVLALGLAGLLRVRVSAIAAPLVATFETVADPANADPPIDGATIAKLCGLAGALLARSKVLPQDAIDDLILASSPGRLADLIVSCLDLEPAQLQWFLETTSVRHRVDRVLDVNQLHFADAKTMEQAEVRRGFVRKLFGH